MDIRYWKSSVVFLAHVHVCFVTSLALQMLSDTSPVSGSAPQPGTTRLFHQVCSAVSCVRLQLKSPIIFRVDRNHLCCWEFCLMVRMPSDSPFLWEPVCHPDVYLCRYTGYQPVPCLVVLAHMSYTDFWRCLYTFLQAIVKRSRKRTAISLTSIEILFISC